MQVIDDEGHDAAAQTFLEQDQTPDAAVAVLKGMDALKGHMEVQQLVQRLVRRLVVLPQEFCHRRADLAGAVVACPPTSLAIIL